jgi:hypothetical protein
MSVRVLIFNSRMRSRLNCMTMRVTVPDGQPSNLLVTLLPADSGVFTPIETAMAMTSGDGTFQFTSVPPGQYTLHVQRSPRMAMGGETTTVVQNNGGSVMRMMTVNRSGGPGAAAARRSNQRCGPTS